MKDHIEVFLLLCFLRLRWAYFHICPWYCKFSTDGTEMHFQNTRTNTIHSQFIVKFSEDSFWKRFDGIY